jgi:hypothetical protein
MSMLTAVEQEGTHRRAEAFASEVRTLNEVASLSDSATPTGSVNGVKVDDAEATLGQMQGKIVKEQLK